MGAPEVVLVRLRYYYCLSYGNKKESFGQPGGMSKNYLKITEDRNFPCVEGL